MDKPLLFLTAEERERLFAKLPSALQSHWEKNIRPETIDAYESPKELQMRLQESKFASHPGVKAMFDKMVKHVESGKKGDPFEAVQMEDFPPDALPSLLFTIGAAGTEAFIQMLLGSDDVTEEDMESIASLTRARHRMLQLNAVLAR